MVHRLHAAMSGADPTSRSRTPAERYGAQSGNRLHDLAAAISKLRHSALLPATRAGYTAPSALFSGKKAMHFHHFRHYSRSVSRRKGQRRDGSSGPRPALFHDGL